MIDFRSYGMGEDKEVLVIELAGQLDSESCSYFFSCLEDAVEDGASKIVVDCRALEFISSMGLGMLIRAHARMKKRGGDVKLARVPGLVVGVFKTTGLDRIFHIYPSVREAYGSF